MDKIFLSDKDNFNFSEMNAYDKQLYLSTLKNYLIEYRDSLGINPNNTFGIEVEYEGVSHEKLIEPITYYTGWNSIIEKGFEVGGEVVSPVLIDNPMNWKDIKDILNIIKNTEGTYATSDAGAHVHVGAHLLKEYNNLINFLLLYTVYEGVLYRFGYMDRLNPRKTIISCASPISIELANDLETIMGKKTVRGINTRYERFFGVNFRNLSSLKNRKGKNTIEFRFGNGTFDPVLWQNYINTCIKLLEASKKDLDIDRLLYLVYRIKENRINNAGIDKLNIDQAMEFCDIIFDSALDKTNFMRQYIKDGEETVDSSNQMYSRRFTRGA